MINDGNGSVGHRLLDGVPQRAHHLFLNLSFVVMEILVWEVFSCFESRPAATTSPPFPWHRWGRSLM